MLPVIYLKDFEISIHAPRGGSDYRKGDGRKGIH